MQPRDRLSAKEVQVATLVWQGLTNKDVAAVLHTSEQVVKNYLRTTFDKLGVWTRLELALYVASHGGANWHAQIRGSSGAQGPRMEYSNGGRSGGVSRGGESGGGRIGDHGIDRWRGHTPVIHQRREAAALRIGGQGARGVQTARPSVLMVLNPARSG